MNNRFTVYYGVKGEWFSRPPPTHPSVDTDGLYIPPPRPVSPSPCPSKFVKDGSPVADAALVRSVFHLEPDTRIDDVADLAFAILKAGHPLQAKIRKTESGLTVLWLTGGGLWIGYGKTHLGMLADALRRRAESIEEHQRAPGARKWEDRPASPQVAGKTATWPTKTRQGKTH